MARETSRRIADEFMEHFPRAMQLSSNYNTLYPLLKRGLSPALYTPGMFWENEAGSHGTVAMNIASTPVKLFRVSIEQVISVENYPDLNQLMGHTNMFTLEMEQAAAAVREPPRPWDPRAPAGAPLGGSADKTASKFNVPMMNGSFACLTDSDGQSGPFVSKGSEYLYTMHYEDAPNRIVTSVSASGVVTVLYSSQRLEEPVNVRSSPIASTVRNIWLYLIPNRGVMVQIASDEASVMLQEHSQSKAMNGLMPIAVFVDSLLWHMDESPRRVTVRDMELLFEGIEAMPDTMETPIPVPAAERARFSALAQNIVEFSTVRAPSASMQPARNPFAPKRACPPHLAGVFMRREFFPHLRDDPSLGGFDDRLGITRLGFLRRMVAEGFAALYGLVHHEKMALTGLRVRTPEADVYSVIRTQLFQHVENLSRPGRSKATKSQSVMEMNLAQDKGIAHDAVIAGFFAKRNNRVCPLKDAEMRRSFPNFLQKLHMIKYNYDSNGNDVNASRRRHDATTAGVICGADTPSNVRVGRDMSPNLNTLVSSDVDPILVFELLRPWLGAVDADATPVYLNGVRVATCADAAEARERVRALRRRVIRRPVSGGEATCAYRPFLSLGVHVGVEPGFVGGGYRLREAVYVRADAGRFYKPTFRLPLPEAAAAAGFWELADAGHIEFLDVAEEHSAAVRICPELWGAQPGDTHADLHPALLQAELGSLVPHSKNNHGVKITNMCNHLKAVMHRPSLQYTRRNELYSYIGFNNQNPVIEPSGFRWCEMQHRPHGYNVVIAIGPEKFGRNQEDALVVRRSFCDRGFGMGTAELSFTMDEVDGSTMDKEVGSSFGPNDVLMRTHRLDEASCVRAGLQESGVVTDIRKVTHETSGRNKQSKTQFVMSTHRACLPELGDKFTTPHSQKGVIGKIVDDMDMPYTAHGLRPDVVLNPQSIPSRMTVAQLIEIVSGSAAVAEGRVHREFTYDETSHETLMEALSRAEGVDGMERAGLQTFYDPLSGEPLPSPLFTGVCYYSRLKHMVSEKVRANDVVGGEVCPITRQGELGRKNNGGVKVAEMERWCIVANGAAHTVNEMYRNLSDGAVVQVEQTCTDGQLHGRLRANPSDVAPETKAVQTNYSTVAFVHKLNSAMLDVDVQLAGGS